MTDARSARGGLSLVGDFRLLLILFVSFRLILLIVYQPMLMGDGEVERGLGAQGDRLYHYELSALVEDDLWPFLDWWSEFPPVWYLLTTAVYELQGEEVNYSGWSAAMGLILLGFETGILILMRLIGGKLYGRGMGISLAWIYALTVAPVVFMWWNFESMVAFFLLLGLWWFIRERDMRSAVAVAIGALTKFTPALLFGAAIRFRKTGVAARYIVVATAIFVLVYAPFMLRNAEMTLPSLTAQFGKASYQSVWALIDGNYRTGNFGAVDDHFDPDFANEVQGNAPVIPAFVRLAVAGAIGLFVFLRTRRFDDIGVVSFTAITLLIFFLQSQGWSPQWLVQIIPLVLLAFPSRNGVLISVVLTLLSFFEYPVLFIRTGATGGEITGPLVGPFAAVVIARTVILIGVCIALYGKLRQEPVPELAREGKADAS